MDEAKDWKLPKTRVVTGRLTINSNIASANAQRRLWQSTSALGESFAKLSSGLRINKASDDAAGLAIAKGLNTDKRVYSQGVRNLNDGVQALNVAESALNSLTNIVLRLTELAEQSANGLLGEAQRKALDDEAQALGDEYFRISKSATFNEINLLDGSISSLDLQGGYGKQSGLSALLGGEIGTGSFGPTGVSYSTESQYSYGTALGDLNGDGFLDLVTAGQTDSVDGAATVRLGNGDGSFTAASSYTTESKYSYAVALGDLNGDGILDLVTAGEIDAADGYATVRLGNGDGSFGNASSYATEGGRSYAIALGDLNGDGISDLVTAGYTGSTSDGHATVRLGIGDGSFGAASAYTTESELSTAAALGDLNHDGFLDLITAGRNDGGNGYATVRLGNGDGSFGGASHYATETWFSLDAALADVDGDNNLDLITAGQTDDYNGYATIRLGKGDGSFGVAISYTTESWHSCALALGDLNGDGAVDLVTAGTTDNPIDGYATIQLGNGDGSFAATFSYATDSRYSYAISLGDLNTDGVLDFVTAGRTDSNDGTATVYLATTKDGVSPLLPFDLSTQSGAKQALPMFQQKLQQLNSQRAGVGAYQSRLGVAISTLEVAAENFSAAQSQILDADVAEESAKLIKNKILQQAGAAVLAQANQAPNLVLSLLQNS